MSGDVQPRKRKDKKRRKEDDDVAKPVPPSPTSNVGGHQSTTKQTTSSEDVQFHVHSDHGTGGHWCAKIIFFILMAILAGLVGLILLENRGISDLDTPLSESRFADYLEGWVEEKRESHDDHADHSLDELLDDAHGAEPFSEEAIGDDDEDDHDDEGGHDDDDHDDGDDDHEDEEEEEENSEEANDENDEPSVAAADEEDDEQQNDDDDDDDDDDDAAAAAAAADNDDDDDDEKNDEDAENNSEEDLENHASDNSIEEDIVEQVNSHSLNNQIDNADDDDDADDADDNNDDNNDDDDDDSNNDNEQNDDNDTENEDSTEKPETDATEDNDNDDDPFEEIHSSKTSDKSLNDTNSKSRKPTGIIKNRQLATTEPIVTVENLKHQVNELYDTYNKIADNLNLRKFNQNYSDEDIIKTSLTRQQLVEQNQMEDDHDDDASFEQVIENDDGEELHLQKLAQKDEVTSASSTADDDGSDDDQSNDSSLSVDDEQTNESNEYKRRLTLVTAEEPIPSDIDDEQPIEDELYDDEDLDEELNGEDEEQDETEPEEDDLEYSEEEYDENNVDEGQVSDHNEETIVEQGGTIKSFEKMRNMYLPQENTGDNRPVVKFVDDVVESKQIIADQTIIPKRNNNFEQYQQPINQENIQKIDKSVEFNVDDGTEIDDGGSIKVVEEGGEIESANKQQELEISDDNEEDELEENDDDESMEGDDDGKADEEDISEDDDAEDIDDDDDDEDIDEDLSDVDDSDLMKRLESKYGKLPEDKIASTHGHERVDDKDDEDDYDDDDDEEIDASWTKITRGDGGAQSFDEDDGDIEEELRRANELLEENPNVALKLFNELMTIDRKTSIKIRYGRAKAFDRLAEINKSNQILDNAIVEYRNLIIELGTKLSDDLYKKITTRCIELMRFKGQHLKAIELHNAIIQRFNDQPSYRNELAITYLLINRMPEAKQVLHETLLRWPKDGVAAVHYGFILKNLDNNLEKAVTLLEEGINSGENGTNDGRFYFALGDALMRLGRTNKARLVYQKGAANGLFLSEYQRSLYNVNRLKSKPFWTKKETNVENYFQILELNWKMIRDEGLSVLKRNGEFTNDGENLRDTGDWKQFDLFSRGRKIVKHCERTPFTCKIIETFPAARFCNRGQVKFSVMHPGTHVWPHCGPTNCRIRAHLGLKVPGNTLIRVANETRTWEDGKLLIFDDSFEHEVWHNGTSLRLVLIVDIWHPDLTEAERSSLYPI